jgi:hypothetical protein
VVLGNLFEQLAPDVANRVEFDNVQGWASVLLKSRELPYNVNPSLTQRLTLAGAAGHVHLSSCMTVPIRPRSAFSILGRRFKARCGGGSADLRLWTRAACSPTPNQRAERGSYRRGQVIA